jgi:hypothetical protein
VQRNQKGALGYSIGSWGVYATSRCENEEIVIRFVYIDAYLHHTIFISFECALFLIHTALMNDSQLKKGVPAICKVCVHCTHPSVQLR